MGVGASAGGLEAFKLLLENLPTDTGMAFVLVQHLDPGHPSALSQLLKKSTQMPVTEVTNNLRVEQNHVYVIPPNTAMIIAKGILKLQPRQKAPGGLLRSIDFFFESLAQDQQDKAIGVILSGTASDGTAGLEAIKAEGGVTFAQDDSAKYDSMPRSAVAAGGVDFVLSPGGIAKELADISRHPYVAGANNEPVEATAAESKWKRPAERQQQRAIAGGRFARILMLLRNHTGVDFSLYKSNTIYRRINRRMMLNKFTTLDQYAHLLRSNPSEADALFSDLLISVTGFFRNPEAFDVLKRVVFPRLVGEPKKDVLRVWVLGCSTGQEAYSIAMAFTEYAERLPRRPRLQVFATDLHEGVLGKARAGLYPKTVVADVSPKRLRRFFREEEGGYRVIKSLREGIVFARQNALTDPPFSRIDLVSCRNLLIYLEGDLQKKLISRFHYALKPGGFLFLGASESVGLFTDLFQVVDKKHKIFSRKGAQTPPLHMRIVPRHPHDQKEPRGSKLTDDASGLRDELTSQREADRVSLHQYAPPSVLVNGQLQVIQFRGDTSAYLKPPTGKASFNLLKMAREGLMLPLRTALNKARKENRIVRRDDVQVQQDGETRTITLRVIPLKNLKDITFLVFFEDATQTKAPHPGPLPFRRGEGEAAGRRQHARGALRSQKEVSPSPLRGERAGVRGEVSASRRRITELERELAETQDYVQSLQEQYEAANEELQASNEEVTSANEELQSINEELETSKEELEATNEELSTVNEEMSHRNVELGRFNADLLNFQGSANMAIVLLDPNLIIRRFTAMAAKQFNLRITDVGRRISDIRHNLDIPDLEGFIAGVIDKMQEQECEVRDRQGRWYALRVRPYLTLEREVEGAVLVLVDIDGLKRNAEELIQAREYAEAIVRTATDSLIVLNGDLTIHSANAAFYETFKVSRKETEGQVIYSLGNGQWNIPKLRQLLEEIIPQKTFFVDFEVTHKFDKIGTRVMMLNARMLRDPSRDPSRILLGIHDFTAEREAEFRVRRSEIRFRRLFEAAKDGVLILDPKTEQIVDANPFMTQLLGYTREEMLGKEFCEIGLFKDRAACDAVFQELRQNGETRRPELTAFTKTGQRRIVELVGNLYHEEDEQVIQCNIRDVTERKEVEHQILTLARRQAVLYRLADAFNRATTFDEVYEAALDAITGSLDAERASVLLFDDKGVMRFVASRGISKEYQQAVEGHSPWTPDEADPHPLRIENVERAEMDEELRRAILKEGIGSLAFIPLVYQGRLLGKFMLYCKAPHKFPDEELQVAQNIANQLAFGLERKRGENALREAKDRLDDQAKELEALVHERTAALSDTNKHLEAFVYTIAHDLRAPLRSMQGFSALLVEEAEGNLSETARDFARRISHAAQFMDALLLDLLSFSRVTQHRPELSPVDLERVVPEVVSRLEREIQEKEARVELIGPWTSVLANRTMLMQALQNLISNAVKFSAPDVTPLVRVSAEQRSPYVRVWVEDNGLGIAPEHHSQIFRLFTRLRGENYPGTGIGLAIVQKGIERMGGRVGLESAPGKGSKFWFELKKA